MKRLVIGMTAHVDSGKTTLSEALLYNSGALRRLGRVDHGDAFLDTHSIERARGITVFSKQAVMRCGENEYTLLDTPGHADFSSEAERAFGVLDYAVLVISGTDGVQSHTETLWRLIKRYRIPAFIFVNKMDISNFDRDYILAELKCRLSDRITDFSRSDRESLCDSLALCSEEMMEEFLEKGDIPDELISREIYEGKVFPCYFGSALKMKGIGELAEGLEKYTVCPERSENFGARVYKITSENDVRLTHMKITGGSLRVKTLIGNEKINRIRVYSGAKFTACEEVFAGELCAVEGLVGTYSGQGLGCEGNSAAPVLSPVLSYCLSLPDGTDAHSALEKLRQLEEEDPQLHIEWNSRLREIHVRLMGEIQLEILAVLIKERFGMEVTFGSGSIAYRETIAQPVMGAGHYEPLQHYAEVQLYMEPLEAGSGLVFASDCSEDVLDRNWQRLILTHLEEKTHVGVLTGSPITDMKITLITGRAHLKHTEGGDFRQATYRAVRMGLMSAQSVLLEPWYSFRLEVPLSCVGRALNDLQQMNAEFSAPESSEATAVITGTAPVRAMSGYHSETASYTGGKGRLSCYVKGYYPCINADEVIREIGYDAEGDTDNPADSVFCSHGAGHNVSWREAMEHMHMDSGIRLDGKGQEESTAVRRISSGSIGASDEELMAIFERTYGKINRDPRKAMRRDREATYDRHKAKPLPKGPGYLLVDGYNVIFSWEELKKAAAESFDLARGMLINLLSNYQGYKQCTVILVFDAYKVKGNHREVEQVGNISVVYTKEAETADMYIEKISHELAKDNRVRVVSSDGAEQIIILGNGAYRVTAAEFYEEVKIAEREIRAVIERPKGEKKSRLEIKGTEQ